MLYMNEWEIEDAALTFGDHPVLGPAARTLQNLVAWTNANSDGWAYWPKPCRAAAKLQALLDPSRVAYHVGWDEPTVTPEEYRKALRPIKAFRTRQRAGFVIEEAR